MGKNNAAASGTPDNERFAAAAERSGVDGVFLGHIKGQFVYRGRGNVPYYVDGGAGGEPYTEGPVGTDHGYWHGARRNERTQTTDGLFRARCPGAARIRVTSGFETSARTVPGAGDRALGPSPAAPLGGRARGAEAPLTTKPPAGGE